MAVGVKKIRTVVGQIREEMKKSPKLRKAVKDNHILVLAERGLTFAEIAKAHDLQGCTGNSNTQVKCPVLTMTG